MPQCLLYKTDLTGLSIQISGERVPKDVRRDPLPNASPIRVPTNHLLYVAVL